MLWRLLFPGALLVLAVAVVLFVWRDDLFGDGTLPEIEFRGSEIEGLPPYPGGTQVSGILTLEIPQDVRSFIGEEGASWVAYRTGDAFEDIAFFYQREMELRGHTVVESTGPNGVLWRSDGQRFALHVVGDRIQNLVILGTASD